MPSIVNGLFSGRSGISSHGTAIAVVGDNISNSSTLGYKAARAEFQDLIAGGQAAGKVVGSGSSISAVSTNFEQGTLEYTGKPLDLAIDGNGFFVVADGEQRFYTRAGNFKTDSAGYIVDQNNHPVLGYPGSGSTGDLQPLNTNTVSQSSVASTTVSVSANLDARTTAVASSLLTTGGALETITAGSAHNAAIDTTYADLNSSAGLSTVVNVFDSLGAKHTVTFYFFNVSTNASPRTWMVKGYVNSEEVDPAPSTATGLPREIGTATMQFGSNGDRTTPLIAGTYDFLASVPWRSGASTSAIQVTMEPMTQFSAPSNVLALSQNGQGIGTVTSLDIQKDGKIFALLSNGQSAIIGTIGMVNFANPEGLKRIGGQLLQQSGTSGEPIVGRPQTGTFGSIEAGSVELSTVDIANEFVKMITLQRGFQASSRIITTINQLLNEIIQLA